MPYLVSGIVYDLEFCSSPYEVKIPIIVYNHYPKHLQDFDARHDLYNKLYEKFEKEFEKENSYSQTELLKPISYKNLDLSKEEKEDYKKQNKEIIIQNDMIREENNRIFQEYNHKKIDYITNRLNESGFQNWIKFKKYSEISIKEIDFVDN